MAQVVVGHIADGSYDAVVETFRAWNPGRNLGRGAVEHETELISRGVGYFWIESGSGEVFLPRGTRTQEGDGKPLDSDYAPEGVSDDVLLSLAQLDARAATFHPRIRNPIQAMAARRLGDQFVGDIAGEIWLIVESGLPRSEWTDDPQALAALEVMIAAYREIGWSRKQADGWEPIRSGDQLAATASRPVRVRGGFRYWFIESDAGTDTHTSPARRLIHLRDTAGGCNFAFDAFRRLPLTWLTGTGNASTPDGANWVNSHVVNIAAETSQTHYHPATPVGGGTAQSEMYLVLDPGAYGLKTYGREASLVTFPDVDDLSRFDRTPLQPGSTVYIPPGTGHRGIDVFVNVVTLPGFKPRNEIYIDQRIKGETAGRSPFNAGVTT